MFTGLVVGGIILIAALIVFSYWCVYRAGRERGYDEGRADKAQQQLAERKAERKAGRHAKTQPRTSLVQEPRPRTVMPWYTPLPGPDKPQAGRDSGAGTVTFPRIDLPATTGEMRAVTDDYLTRMAVEEEAYRLRLAT